MFVAKQASRLLSSTTNRDPMCETEARVALCVRKPCLFVGREVNRHVCCLQPAMCSHIPVPKSVFPRILAGVNMELLKQVGYAVTEFPSDFTPHKQIKKVYEARRNMIDTGEGLDWGMAETLAYATLLSEGNHVRLSGQDVERGTFSHRCGARHLQQTVLF